MTGVATMVTTQTAVKYWKLTYFAKQTTINFFQYWAGCFALKLKNYCKTIDHKLPLTTLEIK